MRRERLVKQICYERYADRKSKRGGIRVAFREYISSRFRDANRILSRWIVGEFAHAALALCVMVGVLLSPASCSRAAGPHSLFVDPGSAANATHIHVAHGVHHVVQVSEAPDVSKRASANAACKIITGEHQADQMPEAVDATLFVAKSPELGPHADLPRANAGFASFSMPMHGFNELPTFPPPRYPLQNTV